MFFAPNFVEKLICETRNNMLVEARTLYWKPPMADQIYAGDVNPLINLDNARIGRIKKRTSAGGCQCAHIDTWTKVKGFDENYKQWGSEDQDLLIRMQNSGAKIKWICEERENILVFHQPHAKPNIKLDLEWQEKNKKILAKLKSDKYFLANHNGWGGRQ